MALVLRFFAKHLVDVDTVIPSTSLAGLFRESDAKVLYVNKGYNVPHIKYPDISVHCVHFVLRAQRLERSVSSGARPDKLR